MNHVRIVFDALPSKVRLYIYAAFELIGALLFAAEAAVLATGNHWTPLTATLAAYSLLSSRVHALARSNVPPSPARRPGG